MKTDEKRKAFSLCAIGLLGALVLTCSCGIMQGVVDFVSPASPEVTDPKPLPVGTEDLYRFGWLSILLVLFFPKVREPLVNLWTAIFRALAIPFVFIRDWYDRRSGR